MEIVKSKKLLAVVVVLIAVMILGFSFIGADKVLSTSFANDNCEFDSKGVSITLNGKNFHVNGTSVKMPSDWTEIKINSIDYSIIGDDCQSNKRIGNDEHPISVLYSYNDSNNSKDWNNYIYYYKHGSDEELADNYNNGNSAPIDLKNKSNVYIKIMVGYKDKYGHQTTSSEVRQIHLYRTLSKVEISYAKTAGANKVKLTWRKDPAADGYMVYAATSSNGKYKKVSDVSASQISSTVENLKAKTTYWFKVRSYNSGGAENIYGSYSEKKSIKTTKKVNISFNGNAKNVKKLSTKSKNITYKAKYKKLPSPKRTGYKFKGWYTKKNGGKKITKNSVMKYKKPKTLYAHWTKNGKVVNCKTATMRSGAGKSYKSIGKVKNNQKVCVLGKAKNGKWYKIKAGKQTGYVLSKYIKKI